MYFYPQNLLLLCLVLELRFCMEFRHWIWDSSCANCLTLGPLSCACRGSCHLNQRRICLGHCLLVTHSFWGVPASDIPSGWVRWYAMWLICCFSLLTWITLVLAPFHYFHCNWWVSWLCSSHFPSQHPIYQLLLLISDHMPKKHSAIVPFHSTN